MFIDNISPELLGKFTSVKALVTKNKRTADQLNKAQQLIEQKKEADV